MALSFLFFTELTENNHHVIVFVKNVHVVLKLVHNSGFNVPLVSVLFNFKLEGVVQ